MDYQCDPRRASPKHRENMTGGVNCGGGRRTRLGNCLGCARGAPHIYIGGRERGGSEGAPQVGSESYSGFPQVAPSLPYFTGDEREGGREKGKGGRTPFSLLQIQPPAIGGAPPLVGWCAPLSCPIWPIYSPGGSGNPSGTPIITRYTPEHF